MSLIRQGRSVRTGYVIPQSIRFGGVHPQYMTFSPSPAGDRKTYTLAFWVKFVESDPGGDYILTTGADANNNCQFARVDDGTNISFVFAMKEGAVIKASYEAFDSDQMRDPTGWYHVVWGIDTSQATASDRVKCWVNGVAMTLTVNTEVAQNYEGPFNNAQTHYLGTHSWGISYSDQFYLAEARWIDGQQLAASDFGEFDANGHWQPRRYTGTYGDQGWFLDGADNADLGNDVSGNNNDWTETGFATDDQFLDSPTPDAARDTGNYAVLNGLGIITQVNAFTELRHGAPVDGGLLLDATGGTTGQAPYHATIFPSSGKWYVEGTIEELSSANYPILGIYMEDGEGIGGFAPGNNQGMGWWTKAGKVYDAELKTSVELTMSTVSTNDVIGMAIDIDNGKLYFSLNGVWENSGDPVAGTGYVNTVLSDIQNKRVCVSCAVANTDARIRMNFGQTPFNSTPPVGFKAIATQNLPNPAIPDPTRHFETIAYTGDGNSGREINGLSFRPDMIWFKQRSLTDQHWTHDVIRGADHYLSRPGNSGSTLFSPNEGCQSFDADGFTLGNHAGWNQNAATYVAWCWKAGGAGVANNDGSVTATVSVNTTAGFSVVKYTTPSGTAAYTVGHGLGVKPAVVIYKDMQYVNDWQMWHQDLTGGGADKHISPSTTAAEATSTTIWNNTEPTASVFSGKSGAQNANTDHIAYIWAEVEGFSRFGRYQGNNDVDGPFVYCGFRPALVWIKRISGVGDWFIWDNKRSPANAVDGNLWLSLTTTETTADSIDLLANGFKLRRSGTGANGSGDAYIFAAFAEAPFKYARAR